MTIDPTLIERIYEAAALPERWPAVFQQVADGVGAVGAALIVRAPGRTAMVVSPRLAPHLDAYVADGWAADRTHVAPLFDELYPGFRSETDLRSPDEIARLPVHAEFLGPRGLTPGAGTVLQGVSDDSLQLAVQGFGSHAAAAAALSSLDALRPPLARALSLSAHLGDRAATSTVAALDLAGIAAAVVSPDSRVRALNERFAAKLGDRIDTARGRLRFADRFAQARVDDTLTGMNDGGARSIALPGDGDSPAVALHLLPLRRDARDVFGWDGVLILLAEAANASIPGADLLRLLFDLTPAEARLTRLLLEGCTPIEAARTLAITDHTARTHLRRIFAKTGVTRQAELVRLLLGLGGPEHVHVAQGNPNI